MESVKVPVDVFNAMIKAIESLPGGQVFGLLKAIERIVEEHKVELVPSTEKSD